MTFLTTLWKAINVFFAMNGLRLDSVRMLIAWIPLLGLSLWIAYYADENDHHLPFVIGTWLFYYGGISLILGTNIKHFMMRKLGEEKALAVYDMICGVMFFNLGSGIGLAALHAHSRSPRHCAVPWQSATSCKGVVATIEATRTA